MFRDTRCAAREQSSFFARAGHPPPAERGSSPPAAGTRHPPAWPNCSVAAVGWSALFGPIFRWQLPTKIWGYRPQHSLYFLPLLQGHGALRPVPGYLPVRAGVVGRVCDTGALLEGSIEPRWCIRGNISSWRWIIGMTTQCRKASNSSSSIFTLARTVVRDSSRASSGNNARFQQSWPRANALFTWSTEPSVESSSGCV